MDSAREGSLSRIPKKEEPQIVKDIDISVDGHAGRFLQIELKSDGMVRMRYTVVGNRAYAVGVGSPKTRPTVVDATNDYEAIATRFMDSFKIIPPLEADKSSTWKEFSSTDGNLRLGELDLIVKRGMKFNVLSECATSVDGYPGRILVLETSDNRIYRRKMLVVKNRVYIVGASAPRDDAKTGNSYETLSLRFLDSFSFLAQQEKN